MTMAEQSNQAERAAPCPLCNSDQVQICRDANNTAKDTARCRECKCTGMLSIWNRRAAIPAAVDAVDLPAPEMESLADISYAQNTPADWDDDYRQIWQKLQVAERNKIQWRAHAIALRRQIAADRRKQAMTQPASIDTPEFRDLLLDYAVDWRDGEDTDRKINNLIAYIDGRTAGAADPVRDATWRDLLEAVMREFPRHMGRSNNGNAPGHCHSRPGIWDDDNGALAGKPCAWCIAWNGASQALAAPSHQSPGKEGDDA